MFTLAHLTDPHLSPLPRPTLRELMSKRITGYVNWITNRHAVYDRSLLDHLVQDLLAQDADHIAVGGDLINLALRDEYQLALDWLQTLGSPEKVSLVPGNHDAYVETDYKATIGLWDAYMTADVRRTKALAPAQGNFPFVRRFGKVALIGLRSGIPVPWFKATGELGQKQREALDRMLRELGKQDYFRVVLIHHPPLHWQSMPQRGLTDAPELEQVLKDRGAELVLYGHKHVQALDMLDSRTGAIPIVGTPSASSCHARAHGLARYNLFRIEKTKSGWTCEMTGRGLEQIGGKIKELERLPLTG